MALMWGRSSRMTEEQRPICSGVLARPILHKGGFVSGMEFLRLPRAEIKPGIRKK